MDRATIEIYEAQSARYEALRRPQHLDAARAFGARRPAGPTIDLGSGPGGYTAALGGRPVVALDAAAAMLRRTREVAPGALAVQADLLALPFRRGALASGWARNTYVHLRAADLPMGLNDLHHALAPGAPAELTLFGGDTEGRDVFPDDDLPGRWFSTWSPERLTDVIHGAGFVIDDLVVTQRRDGTGITARVTRDRTLPDFVGPDMRLLASGLNPSEHAADAGVGYVTPGNRFWPAALEAGLVTRDRDPRHALREHGLGMTDLVKRATPRADALDRSEYRAGLGRLDRLCAWLQPGAVAVVGLAGWRAAVDRKATPGWQSQDLGGRPVYLMPSTSGLNAATPLVELVDHLRTAATTST